MSHRTLRLLAAATLLAVAGLLLPVTATTAPAQAAACSTVTVVVDFASLGGGASTRCTSGDPSSGLAALQQAGHSYTLVQSEPFVCRIDSKPASDPCTRTPPSSAYWSYWHAKPGGSWTYASTGAYAYNPAPGSVEGWAFGAGNPPSTPPPAPRPTRPTTAAPSPPGGSGSGTGSGGTSGAGTTARHSGASRSAAPHPTASVLGTKAQATPTASLTSTSATPGDGGTPMAPAAGPTAGAEPPGDEHRIPAPLLALCGLLLIGGLGGAAWWRARR